MRKKLHQFAFVFLAALAIALPSARARAEGMQVVRDEEIEQTLKAFARPVFDQAGVSSAAVRFILVQDDTLNAFVAGGQNMFMHTGLLLETESAAEVTGVIAHETGHIALGHLFRMNDAVEGLTVQSLLANIVGIAVGIGTGSGAAGMAASRIGQDVALRNTLTHSRTQESSADEAGIRYLKTAGLPVAGFASFMEKLENQELLPATQQDAYVRTHPLTQERVDVLRRASEAQGGAAVPAAWDRYHARMKAKLMGYLRPDRALTDRAETIEARYARAIAEYRKGRIDKSLALIGPLLREEPDNPWFHELNGQVLFESGRIAESLAPYARAVELAPYSGLIRIAYGHALLEAGGDKNMQEAERQLQLARNDEPRVPDIHRHLAVIYGKRGDEGLSRLHLAEQYLLLQKPDLATREARLALTHLPEQGPARLRAQDVLDAAERAEERMKKK